MSTHLNRWKAVAMGVVIGAVSTAQAVEPLPRLEEGPKSGGSITLADRDANQLDYALDYPGLEVRIVAGEPINDWTASDCLVLVDYSWGGPVSQAGLEELAGRLEISDGGGILLPERTINVLDPRVVDGTHVWFLEDLGTYVTGVRVKVKDGQSFASLLQEIFGDEPVAVELEFSRGCHILGEAVPTGD